MCQYKAEGGRRCPVHRYDSMATIKHVVKHTGLPRDQVEKIFTELREEGRGREQADVAAWTQHMRKLEENSGGSAVVVKNLAKARESLNAPDQATFYALTRLEERAGNRAEALSKKLSKTARSSGLTKPEATQVFRDAMSQTRRSEAVADERTIASLEREGLPADARTAVALQAVSGAGEREEARRVAHQEVSSESSQLGTVGYDPEDGRLELTFRRDPDTIYSYRNVPSEVWSGISSGSMYVYSHHVRGNPDYVYEDAEAAEADAHRVRCSSCGQFRASSHSCPRAKTSAQAKTVSPKIKVDENAAMDGDEYAARWAMPPALMMDPLYPSDEEVYNYLSYRDVYQSVESVATVEDPSKIRQTYYADGEATIPARYTLHDGTVVEGTITVSEDPDDRFGVLTTDNDLKCTCADYAENYDCVHVRAFKDQGDALLHHDREDYINLNDGNMVDFLSDNEKQVYAVEALRDRATENSENGVPSYEEALAQSPGASFTDEDDDAEVAEQATASQEELMKMFRENPGKFHARAVKMQQAQIAEVVAQNEADYAQYRQALLERAEDRDPGYTNDPEKFAGDFRRAYAAAIPYEYSNVLDGAGDGPGARKFGVELEFSVSDDKDYDMVMDAIGHELYEEGLTDSPYQEDYHTAAESGWAKWSFEEDNTVDGEIVSPLLSDDEESWKQLRKVCEIIKKHGGTVDAQCGSHVHVSSGSYGLSTAKHGELQRSVSQHEDVLYRLATNPNARSKKHRGIDWCKPNTNDPDDDIGIDVEESHHVFKSAHANNLNMTESGSEADARKSHVELRMWDGSLDPGTIQQQIKASVALVDHAERSVVVNGGSKKKSDAQKAPLGSSLEKEQRILAEAGTNKHTPETLMRSNESTVAFLDTVFRRHSDRQAVLGVLARNSWQRL